MIKSRRVTLSETLMFWLLALALCFITFYISNASSAGLDTLLMTEEQRANIDEQRVSYLKNQVAGEQRQGKQSSDKAKANLSIDALAHNITVSAVIEKPNGERTVRVNNRFQTVSTASEFRAGNKMVTVPVGSTYLSTEQKVVETHTLDRTSSTESQR